MRGIADPGTQRQLERAVSVPMLKCLAGKPTMEEWAVYLNADLHQDKEYFWVVQAFSEVRPRCRGGQRGGVAGVVTGVGGGVYGVADCI